MNEQTSVAASLDAPESAQGAEGGRAKGASFLPSFALLVVAYTAAAVAGLQFALVSGAASPIWPAAGIALACVLNAGRRMWPGIVIGAIAAYQLTGAEIPFWIQLVISLGNAAAAVIGAEVITRFGRTNFRELATLRSILLLLFASLVAGATSAVVGPTTLLLSGDLGVDRALSVYIGWFAGDAVGMLLIAGSIISWSSALREDWPARRIVHLFAVMAAVALLGVLVFFDASSPRAWAIYPALVWAALALQVRGTALALVVATLVASAGTLLGQGPFAPGGAPDLILLQQYLAVTCATCLLLAGAVEERNSESRLREVANAELQARELAAEAQRRLTLAMDVSRTGIWDWDLVTQKVEWTAKCYDIHGVEPGKFGGTAEAFQRMVHPDDADALFVNVTSAIERREEYQTEFRILRPDGTVRWVANSGQATYSADGQALRMVGTITDITERKETEATLSRLAERAEIAQQAARSSLYEFDPATQTALRDPLIRESLGYSPEELSENQADWERVIHPDDVPEFRSTVAQALDRAERFAMEYRAVRKDGSVMWVSDVGRIIRDSEGRPERIVGMASDVTDRKEAEEELRRTTSLLRSIGDSAGGMIFAKDRDGRYLYTNEHVRQVTGRSFEELRGTDDRSWATPDLARLYMDNDRRIMETGAAKEVDEEAIAPDGSRRLYRSLKAPLRDDTGEVIGLVGIATDITDRRAAEDREQLLAREVDHRAKNLLAVVQSVVQMSRAEDIESFKAGVLGRIQSLARAHSLLAEARWSGVGLEQIVAEELAPFRVDGRDRIRIEGPPLSLTPAASQSLALVLHELATNAAKYGALGHAGGSLTVGWTLDEDGSAKVEWREASGRATTPPSRSGFGSRLIQASVQRQLRGTLAYDWGQDGLTVRFSIPAEHLLRLVPDQGSPATAPRAPREIVTGTASCRILIVEDEALIGMQLEQALVDHGCEVVGVATSVAEALQLVERERPHGALLDINLAGEKSFPVAERLAENGVPFVFCTGYVGEQVLPPRFAGAPLVRKPFDAQAVAAIFLDLDGTGADGSDSGNGDSAQ